MIGTLALVAALACLAGQTSAQGEFQQMNTNSTWDPNVVSSAEDGKYIRACYYTNWAQYRPDKGKFYPEDVDTSLCTHLIYAFATMSGNRLKAYEWNDESEEWMVGMWATVLN